MPLTGNHIAEGISIIPGVSEQPVQLAVILCIGRSGSTLLRNELAKPADVSALTSDFGYRWVRRYQELLRQPDPAMIAAAAPAMRAAWREEGFWREEIKYRFSTRPAAQNLQNTLLLKFALFGFASLGMTPFEHHARMMLLVRDPLDVALSHCRPLSWNNGAAFWAGARADRLPANLQMIAEFSRAVGFDAPPAKAILAGPYSVSIALFLEHYYALLTHVATAYGACGRLTVTRFEDLLRDRRAELERLAGFLGVTDQSFPDNADFYQSVMEEGGIHVSRNTEKPPQGSSPRVEPAVRRMFEERLWRTRRQWGYPT